MTDIEALVKRLEVEAYGGSKPWLREAATALRQYDDEDKFVKRKQYDDLSSMWAEDRDRLRQLEQERDALLATDYEAIREIPDDYAALRSRITELEGALGNLLERWDICLPHINGAEGMAYVHGWRWKGPEDGMLNVVNAARALLSPKSEVATSGQNKSNMTTSE